MRLSLRRIALVLGIMALGSTLPAQADIVTDWAATSTATVLPGPQAAGTIAEQFPNFSVDLATVHIAIYDTVVAFKGGYEPFAAVPASIPPGASFDAAVHEAAYQVLSTMFPSRSALYLGTYNTRMAAAVVADGQPAVDAGKAVGADVANQILTLRGWKKAVPSDGREVFLDTSWAFVTPQLIGVFVPRPAPLVNANVPNIKPFTLSKPDQFKPKGPPQLKSGLYAKAFDEVKALGIADGVNSPRSADEDNLSALATDPPGPFYTRNLRRLLADNPLSLVDNARVLAAGWVAQSDAFIGCFDAKYNKFRFWRPRTAIPAAADDGNKQTVADPTWTPNEVTPNHPEYPSAHSCGAGSLFEVVRKVYGTKNIPFSIDNTSGSIVRTYASTGAFLDDLQDARIFGGMHFRFATADGMQLGNQTAKWVMKHHFRPVEEEDEDEHEHESD
jgi:hypothetical protein